MNITPLHDRVIVKPKPLDTVTEAGIIIPDTAKEKPVKGEVVGCGSGTGVEKMTVKVGDVVLYGKHAGTEMEYEGEKYLIMRENDILAIV